MHLLLFPDSWECHPECPQACRHRQFHQNEEIDAVEAEVARGKEAADEEVAVDVEAEVAVDPVIVVRMLKTLFLTL